VEGSDGRLSYVTYAEIVLKDSVAVPPVKAADFQYDHYLFDVQSAAQLGLNLPLLSIDAKALSNYRVEFTFYQSAVSRIGIRDIDRAKFNAAAARIAKDLQSAGLKLRGYRVVSAAVALHSAYALLKGSDVKADASGLGWVIGGKFYASQKMEKNRVKVGLTLLPLAPDSKTATYSSTDIDIQKLRIDIQKMIADTGKSPSQLTQPIDPTMLKLDKMAYTEAFSIEGVRLPSPTGPEGSRRDLDGQPRR
jgi:hypothetical protein